MGFKTKLLITAMASAMPLMSVHAQTQAELQKEIAALRAQLMSLQQKVEAMGAAKSESVAPATAVAQQVNRLEQRMDLADEEAETTGFKGMKISASVETGFGFDSQVKSNDFYAASGSATDSRQYGGYGMVQFTKETQGEGVDWTLRLLPGADATSIVHEASISLPLAEDTRLIGGVMPDFQGYEFVFANANSTLGNQLISHNALYDLAGATQYAGLGTSHSFDGGTYTAKWILGNVDASTDTDADTTLSYFNGSKDRSVALAYRGDWFINEFAYIGLSGLHGSVNRNFRVMALDGGYTRGDWQFNGQLTSGWMRNAASNGSDAEWHGVSGLVGFKATPRLQLIARADYLENSKNGGGTYVALQPVAPDGATALDNTANGLGPVRNADGLTTDDANVGANLTRLTLGTNYQINANAQWKTEYRVDTSTGYNFIDQNGVATRQRTRIGTAFILSF